jgi:DNA-directed RNA polymerase specialized sigma24 family protein
MPEDKDEVTVWLQAVQQGSPAAATKIWQYFFDRLVRYADRKLGGVPRREADEEDLALSALHDLHRGILAGQFPALGNRDDLWKILVTITSRKAGKRIRRMLAAKRGGGQVRGESIFGDPNENRGSIDELVDADAIQGVAEELSVECQELLDRLEDDVLQKIAIMKLQGFTNEEIAGELKCTVRAVERKLARIRVLWA